MCQFGQQPDLQGETGKQAYNKQNLLAEEQMYFCLLSGKNVLAEHEMFEKFGGGEESNQRDIVETVTGQK